MSKWSGVSWDVNATLTAFGYNCNRNFGLARLMIKRLGARELETKFGTFTEILYYDGQKESIAIVMGDVAEQDDVLCRVHSHCIGAHVFNSVECTCREEMEAAQRIIQEAGRGVIVWLDQEGKGN